jgi:cell wall-associated NlpC family hydrolase
MKFRNLYLSAFCLAIFATAFASDTFSQYSRPRIVVPTSGIEPPQKQTVIFRPVSSSSVIVAGQSGSSPKLVKKTVMSAPTNVATNTSMLNRSFEYGESTNRQLLNAIQARMGIRYHYGSTGPGSYDCSGLVWRVFQDAGIDFGRTSAATIWRATEPVTDDQKYRFGTLVFFNNLKHMGIVADENGFYHASSSKGVTYSPFAGYWEKRIVGFRRIAKKAV